MTFKKFVEETNPSDFEEVTKVFTLYLIYGVLAGCLLGLVILGYKIIAYL